MCYYCGEPIRAGAKIGFSELCEKCGREIHVCAMCGFYLPGAHWDCHETVDAEVSDKEKRNFCEYFVPAERFFGPTAGQGMAKEKAESAKADFESLFRT